MAKERPMTKKEFESYPRFYQWMLAKKYGLKPEKRIRNIATQKLADKQRGKSLQLTPDKAPDYFWSDSRDLYKEILYKIRTKK